MYVAFGDDGLFGCNELENPIGIETYFCRKRHKKKWMLQRTWKPDRDWNITPRYSGLTTFRPLQRTWKPDRDWNTCHTLRPRIAPTSCNELENPIGIETHPRTQQHRSPGTLQRTWKPDRDWNWSRKFLLRIDFAGCNELENPIGIETWEEAQRGIRRPVLQRTWKPDRDWNSPNGSDVNIDLGGCNELENPIGIETSKFKI